MSSDISQLIEKSNQIKLEADLLLHQTGIIDTLKKCGDIHFVGAYAGNVMMHGDIDIMVVRDIAYSSEEVFEILKVSYGQGKFRSYFIKGDWDDDRIGKEFPLGHYIGMKQRLNGSKWKVDVWFVPKKEFEERAASRLNISNISLSSAQRELILQMKKNRQEHTLDISGQEIYEAVLQGGVENLEQWKVYRGK